MVYNELWNTKDLRKKKIPKIKGPIHAQERMENILYFAVPLFLEGGLGWRIKKEEKKSFFIFG